MELFLFRRAGREMLGWNDGWVNGSCNIGEFLESRKCSIRGRHSDIPYWGGISRLSHCFVLG